MVSNEIVSLQNKNYKKERRKLHKKVNYLPRQYKPRKRLDSTKPEIGISENKMGVC
jgi:hypothetical protein